MRHVANLVTALNFDYRAIDTLGEEFILLCSVTGVSVLLRGARGEQTSAKPGRVDDRPLLPPSEAVTLVCRAFGVFTLLFGLYVALHATSTPGGGFQGGVIIASGFLLAYLGEGYPGWRKLIRSEWLDAVEAGGAALFVACGVAGPVVGAPFMTNVLSLGTFGSVWSGGLMVVINVGVTLAVAGGFGVLLLEFLEETRVDPDLEERELEE
jgi:multicomponent Na+:H+ antiporter subunit B